MNYDTDSPRTENDAAIEAGALGATPQVITLELGEYHLARDAGGKITQIDLTGDKWLDWPRRIVGTVQLADIDSLAAYWGKYADHSSELWADQAKRTITAILDAHHPTVDGGQARWQQHRAVVQLQLSDVLKAWMANNNKALSQEEFGELIEEYVGYIAYPPAADLMEMVKDLEVVAHQEFKTGVRLKTGARRLQFTETVEGRTKEGTVDIPDTLTLSVPIWQGAHRTTTVTARLRFRANTPRAGQVALIYKLDGLREIIDGAFLAGLDQLAQALSGDGELNATPIYRGTPA
jgi:uncharacterized protein YfdQ (DUF2303 family)